MIEDWLSTFVRPITKISDGKVTYPDSSGNPGLNGKRTGYERSNLLIASVSQHSNYFLFTNLLIPLLHLFFTFYV